MNKNIATDNKFSQINLQKLILRIIIFMLGMVLLAIGITLSTKAALGVSPISSLAYFVSSQYPISFGDFTLIHYSFFALIEIIVHLLHKKPKSILLDMGQLAVSLIFSRFLNLFDGLMFSMVSEQVAGSFWSTIPCRILFLVFATILIGCGACLTLNTNLIPNTADGIVKTLSDEFNWKMGNVKNIFDISNVIITCLLSFVLTNSIIGVGIGTVISMLLTGRVMVVFNKLTLKHLKKLTEEE